MTFQALLDEIRINMDTVMRKLNAHVTFSVEPAKPGFGDASCNVAFLLAGHLQKSPGEIAQTIAKLYCQQTNTLVAKTLAHNSGYVNFVANWSRLSSLILSKSCLAEFGSIDIGKNSVVVVEHTSVNPNKALHIGHVRNIVIGDALSHILHKANYRVNVLNYVDDSGLQVADIIIGFRHFGFPEEPPNQKKFDQYCGDDVYVQTTAKCAKDPSMERIRKNVLKEIELSKSATAQFASRITRKVLSSQLETCWNLGVTYDCLNFESHIVQSGLWNLVFEKLKEMNLIEYKDSGKNSGCWVIHSNDDTDDKVLVRSNGTATYIAKDIPYAAWKLGLLDDPFGYVPYDKKQPGGRDLWQTTLDKTQRGPSFAGDRVITVIDSRQARLQKIITDLISKFKYDDAYIHLSYESVLLSSDTAKILGLETTGRQAQMSGRLGLYVNADSVYDLLMERTTTETRKRHTDMSSSEVEQVARSLSVGALRYEMLKQDLDKTITFDLARSLSLEGDTASYIQYAHARALRILEKSCRTVTMNADCSLLVEPSEIALVTQIGLFDSRVSDAARNLSPKVIARYCHDLAVSFNEFYESVRVLDANNRAVEDSRIFLVDSFRIVIERALDLLGISAPGRM